ncbi:hypothetical protein ARMGADRAFT_1089088 [Armillaria gallica]|uniref:Uncharacterized protein n=1 Tax=Armillaria gallica TaxID=47427 RepID=A0A2H3CYT3_ARMGA|nr:hypothetical protein ARMGADRAFT_1089088 [Armillaria gallica]
MTSLPMDEEIQSWTTTKAEKVKELTWEECTVLQNSEAAAFDSLKTLLVEAEWEAVQKSPGNLKEVLFDVRKHVTRAKWDKALKLVKQLEMLASDYQRNLIDGLSYLQAVADAIRKHFSMRTMVALVGPIGSSGGGIEVCSIHSGITVTGQTWPQFDPQGWGAAETSMIEFGKKSYTMEDCSRRVTSAGLGSASALALAMLSNTDPKHVKNPIQATSKSSNTDMEGIKTNGSQATATTNAGSSPDLGLVLPSNPSQPGSLLGDKH